MPLGERVVTKFLNVDVELRVQSGIEILIEHLEPLMFVLHQTTQDVCLELNKEGASLEDTIINLIEVIQSLGPQAKTIWDQCDYRVFNIGVQGGHEPHEAYFTISNKAISLLASVRAEITFTVYAPLEE